jgi:hypothetical protein
MVLRFSIKQKLQRYHSMTWNKLIPVIFAIILLFVFVPAPVQAAGNVYYVAKNGSNSNPGTEAQPWLTIQKAASTLTAGDTVYVKAGTYREQVKPGNSGTAGNVITFTAYPGDTVIIDGTGISSGSDGHGLVEITGKSYITIDGFEVQNEDTAGGIVGNGECRYITVQNCTVHDIAHSGIFFLYSWNYTPGKMSHIIIDNCETYDTNLLPGDEAIAFIAVENFEVKNCIVRDTGSIAIDMKQGTRNGSVHNCEVYNAGSGIYIDARDGVADGISIYNNLCHDIGGSAGIIIESEEIGAGITNLMVYNNIVYDCNDGIYFGSYGAQPEEVSFAVFNNTLYNNDLGIALLQTYDRYTSGVIRNNIIAGTSGQSLLTYSAYNDTTKTDPGGRVIIDHNLFYNPGGYSTKYGTNSIKANPLLVNPTSNFSIPAGSPAVDAGSSEDAPSFDYANAPRPQGAAYDIGAYEYQSGASSNQAPVLAAIGNKTVTTGQALTFTISATDPNGDSLTYAASNLPSGASFNAANRTFSWTPAADQAGTYSNVRFTVSDGSLADYENITITVNSANQAPVLAAIGNKTVTTGQTLTFTISASDPNGDSLTYSPSNLPSGASFNAANRTFSWTPAANQAGTYSNVRFTVSDGSLMDYENITITVNLANQAPVLAAIGNKTVTTGQTLSFSVSASDPNGDSLTYSATNLPSGAGLNAANRTFSWTPAANQAGTYSNVRFTVSDGSLTDYENITITVNLANQAPVLAAIGNKTVTAGQTLTFTISGTDPDGDSLTYSASNLPSGSGFNISTRTFTWTPSAGQVGTYNNVRFTVSDGSLTYYENITMTVIQGQVDIYDINIDSVVDEQDLVDISEHWGETNATAGWIKEDVNHDGTINILDSIIVGQHFTT